MSNFLKLDSSGTETDKESIVKIKMLKMSNAKKNKELTPELKAFQQPHLSHSLKYQPSHKTKRLISCICGNKATEYKGGTKLPFLQDGLVQRN
jgi:hypothetical protein